MKFTSKVVVERTEVSTRSSVKQQGDFDLKTNNSQCYLYYVEYLCHVYVRADRLSGVLISDHEYPHRVAHTLINNVLDEFTAAVPSHRWPTLTEKSVLI